MRLIYGKLQLRRPIAFVLLIFCSIIIVMMLRSSTIDDIDRNARLKKIDEMIKTKASNVACKQPDLPVFSPEVMKFVHEVPPITCDGAGIDWVVCEGSECRIREEIKNRFGVIKCAFTDVLRINDFELTNGETTYSDSSYKLEASDVVKVSCKSLSKVWSSTLTGIRIDKDVWSRTSWSKLPETATKYNVLMFGFDSMSRNSFIRKLPKSYEYLTKELHALVLKGYNIIGDGTPQALIPILTGRTELELPDTRKRLANTQFVNLYPFVWNNYKENGYVTAYFEDAPEIGTFTYRLNGFNEPPTDHYMRPYYLASHGEINKWLKLCAGDIPKHKVMLNQIRNFFAVYKSKPKFLFGFHAELSHDAYNLIGAADNDVYDFLKDLKESGVLENTILIFMADHGHRFAEIRNTIQGKQEERLPFFSFTFPETFKTHFKKAYENFEENVDKLTTPFDIYSTLRSILELTNVGEANLNHRSVSLFTRIPQERSCAHAYIEPHWCACLEWTKILLESPITQRVANSLVTAINNYTKPQRNLCEVLSLSKTHWVTKMSPNENLIKYNKNADLDGFVADMTANMKLEYNLYQIKITVFPGNSIFEASVRHELQGDRFNVKISDISRVNMYGQQARCVENELPHLRKYCYCR